MDKKLRTRVTNLMRRDLKKTKMYSNAKNRHFKGMTVFMCPACEVHFYTGSSDKNYESLKEEYEVLERCKSKEFHMDHIEPVTPYDKEFHDMTLDEIADRNYCKEDNLQYICESCHKKKTAKEATIRSKYKKIKKLDESP
jgi:hypothetical protein